MLECDPIEGNNGGARLVCFHDKSREGLGQGNGIAMSREIEKQVRGILESDPHGVFATEDLCQRVYGAVDKKHRAPMRRIMQRIEETDPRYQLARSQAKGVEMMLYNCQSARSVALMGYKKRLWLRWLLDPAHDAKAAKYIDERYEEFESGQEVDDDLGDLSALRGAGHHARTSEG